MYHLNKLVFKNSVVGLSNLKFENNRVCEACKRGKQTKNLFKSKIVSL